jgi:hypothetical protein
MIYAVLAGMVNKRRQRAPDLFSGESLLRRG